MRVRELIEALHAMPQDSEVVIEETDSDIIDYGYLIVRGAREMWAEPMSDRWPSDGGVGGYRRTLSDDRKHWDIQTEKSVRVVVLA